MSPTCKETGAPSRPSRSTASGLPSNNQVAALPPPSVSRAAVIAAAIVPSSRGTTTYHRAFAIGRGGIEMELRVVEDRPLRDHLGIEERDDGLEWLAELIRIAGSPLPGRQGRGGVRRANPRTN